MTLGQWVRSDDPIKGLGRLKVTAPKRGAPDLDHEIRDLEWNNAITAILELQAAYVAGSGTVSIRTDSGGTIGARPRLNLIGGSGISVSAVDDPVDSEIDITLAWLGLTVRKNTGADVGTRRRVNLIEGSAVMLTVADDGAGGEIDVTIATTAASVGATPAGAIQIGDSAAAGSSAEAARVDHRHSLAAPGTPAQLGAGVSATGVVTAPARGDHEHRPRVTIGAVNVLDIDTTGVVAIKGGTGAASGAGKAVSVVAGDGGTGNTAGADLTLDAGTKSGSGSDGRVFVGAGVARQVFLGGPQNDLVQLEGDALSIIVPGAVEGTRDRATVLSFSPSSLVVAAQVVLVEGDPNGQLAGANKGSLALDLTNVRLYTKAADSPSTVWNRADAGATTLQTAYDAGEIVAVSDARASLEINDNALTSASNAVSPLSIGASSLTTATAAAVTATAAGTARATVYNAVPAMTDPAQGGNYGVGYRITPASLVTGHVDVMIVDGDPNGIAPPNAGTLALDRGGGSSGKLWRKDADSPSTAWSQFATGGSASILLTSTAPVDVTKAAAAVGTGTTAARHDHKHDISTAAPTSTASANAEGSASSLARSDHAHRTGLQHRKNTGSDLGARPRINWIEGSGITLTVTDDAGSDETDVTIAAAAGATPSLDAVYNASSPDNDVSITTAKGGIILRNSADVTDILQLLRTFGGAGRGLYVSMGATTTGRAVEIESTAGATGDLLRVSPSGTAALIVSALAALTLQGGAGATATAGATVAVATGAGGAASAGAAGGVGGPLTLTTAIGGAASSAQVGGAGGNCTATLGAGGAGDAGNNRAGGVGGSLSFASGTGAAAAGTQAGRQGGTAIINGGTGGAAGASAIGGAGGAGQLKGGGGGASGTSQTAGAGGDGATVAGSGGANTSTGAGGAGGLGNVNGGTGGAASGAGTGGAGGQSSTLGGAGGASTSGIGGAGGVGQTVGGQGGTGGTTGGVGGLALLKGGQGGNGSTTGGVSGNVRIETQNAGTGGVVDAADIELVLGSPTSTGRWGIVKCGTAALDLPLCWPYTNKSGGTLNIGDVVVYDTSTDDAVTTTTTAQSALVAGVVTVGGAADATVWVCRFGKCKMRVYGATVAITRGLALGTHTTAGGGASAVGKLGLAAGTLIAKALAATTSDNVLIDVDVAPG